MKCILVVALCLVCSTSAEELSIRLVGQAQPNSWNVEDIVSGVTAKAGGAREKALALHRFGMAHMIHFNGPIEERNEYVTDPIKLIGVYGYALCGNNSAAMTALYNAAGLKARTRSMPGHSVPEVWFEDRWNYIDTDMFGYVLRPDGKIASVDDLTVNADLFTKQTSPPDPFYPFDRKEDMASVFRHARPSRNHHPYANAHMMNLGLRTGESATLYFRPRGRYLLTTLKPPDIGTVYKTYWAEGPVRRGSLAWCDRPPASYGNGLIEYKPDLRSTAFRLENPQAGSATAGSGTKQPELKAAASNAPASVVIEMNTPWVIAGLQNDLTDFDDDTDGATVSGLFWRMNEADENRISVSTDAGRTWKTVWQNRFMGAVPFSVDLTKYAKGRYAYWVKLEWTDKKGTGSVGIEKLALRTWVALSPMALPRLVAGTNAFTLSTGSRRTWYHESRWDRGEPLAGQRLENFALHAKMPYLRPEQPNAPGVLEFALGPDDTVEEVRISTLIRTLGKIADVSAVLSLSEDGGSNWRVLERFTPDPEHNTNHMWFNHTIRGRTIQGARARLRIAVTGGGLEKVTANSAVRRPPTSPSALRVTHTWHEADQERSSVHVFQPGATARSYEVEAAGGLTNDAVRLEAIAPDSRASR